MTAFEWTLIALNVFALVLGCVGGLISIGRAMGDVRREFAKQIADEVVARTEAISEAVVEREAAINKLRFEFDDKEREMEGHFREIATSLRTFVEAVEKDVRRVEMQSVQNYVPKSDFDRTLAMLSKNIESGLADIKTNIGTINGRLDRWIEHKAGMQHRDG